MFDGFAQQVKIVLFQPFVNKLAGYFYGEHFILELNGLYRFKPGFKILRAHIVSDELQTIAPDLV
jgi:hypothetical protein